MAGNFQYTNFSQYYYDIEILLSTGSNLLTSKSSGAKRAENQRLAAEFPKQCVYNQTETHTLKLKKRLAFCRLL